MEISRVHRILLWCIHRCSLVRFEVVLEVVLLGENMCLGDFVVAKCTLVRRSAIGRPYSHLYSGSQS